MPSSTIDLETRLKAFSKLLLAYNRIHHITGAKNDAQLRTHIDDSLYPLTFLGEFETALDIGTGAGFPGLVMAMGKPQAHFYLCEPLQKRFAFLTLAKSALSLRNVTILPKRIEQVAPFAVDLITSRAVDKAKILIELAHAFAHEQTRYLLFKGERVYEEIEGLKEPQILSLDKRNYLLCKGVL